MRSVDAWELAELDGLAQRDLVRSGEVTAEELISAAFQRVDDVNESLNAVVWRYDEAVSHLAMKAAIAADQPFFGVPTLLKDLRVKCAGAPQSEGSRFVGRFVPDHDSTIVSRMKDAGMTILGRTGSSEFGNENETILFGPTNNPWDLGRSTGGSSAGAAAAVSARVVPLAHGSDGGGSIRLPASWCGVFGLKPTRGRNPSGPDDTEGCGGLITDHVITWSVRDSAAALDVISGPDVGALSVPPRQPGSFLYEASKDPPRLRIGFAVTTPKGLPVEPACRDGLLETAALCEELGHVVEEASPVYDVATMSDEFDAIWADTNAAQATEWAWKLKKELTLGEFGDTTRLLIERGLARSAVQHMTGLATMQHVARHAAEFFASYDMWLTPTAPTVAPTHEEVMPTAGNLGEFWEREAETGAFLSLANITGQPAMSVPLHWSTQGLPVGSHFMARFGAEAQLLGLAGQLERARPWHARRP